jgi:hypothetical protein
MAIINPLPSAPSRLDPAPAFITKSDAFVAALTTFGNDVNAAGALLSMVAAGTAFAVPYVFSTTTTDSDPGASFIRFDNATQNLTTTLRTDLVGADGATWTSVLDGFAASTSNIKGQLRIVKLGDATKWLVFNVTAVASPAGYKNIAVTIVTSSAASPFVNGDQLVLLFTRNGDIGPAGTIVRRPTSIISSATPTPNSANDDIFMITALAVAPTFGAPLGSPPDGQGLIIRIKDNGTARLLAYNAIYRASTDLPLPTSTAVGKVLYLGFVYNAADTKWDLIAVLNNI